MKTNVSIKFNSIEEYREIEERIKGGVYNLDKARKLFGKPTTPFKNF